MTSIDNKRGLSKWLKANIRKNDKLISRVTQAIAVLKEEKTGIEEFLDVLAEIDAPVGEEMRFELGRQEFKLALIEKSIDDLKEYLAHLDEHMLVLLYQALFLDAEENGDGFETLEGAGFTVKWGEEPPGAE